MTDRPSVLLVYADRIGAEMGGVGIRAVELARALATAGAQVTIAAAQHDGSDVGVPVVTFAPHTPRALRSALAAADVVVTQPQWPLLMNRLRRSRARLICDLYDPELFGTLEHFAGRRPILRRTMAAYAGDRLVDALRSAHHVICASERQRDLWLGALLGAGLVSPAGYDADPTLRTALAVVPYGVPDGAPAPGPGARETLGLPADAEIVLWNGGLWSWLDAATAIRAIALLRPRRPTAELVFMGSSSAAAARVAEQQARELAAQLGVLDAGVRFNDVWVPYEQRGGWLLGADCGVSAHTDHLEARFASRTRLLDCIWAGLPVVCTEGDELADRVARDGLGAVVTPGDPGALAAALERTLDAGRAAHGAALAVAAAELRWSRVAAPLAARCLAPGPPGPRLGDGAPRAGSRGRRAAYLLGATAADVLRLKRLPRAG